MIYDEVITALPLVPVHFQDLLGVIADLTAFGKIVGGGLPIGGYGGRQSMGPAEHLLGPAVVELVQWLVTRYL